MKVNVENIGKTVTDGFENVNDYIKSGKPLSVLEKIGANFEIVDFNAEGFSSSDFRENKTEEALPCAVLDYIKSHSLYGYDEIYKAELKKRLKEKRYNHCLNVAQSAKELAEKYGEQVVIGKYNIEEEGDCFNRAKHKK